MDVNAKQVFSVAMKIRTGQLPVDPKNGELWDVFLSTLSDEDLRALEQRMRDPFAWRHLLSFSYRMRQAGATLGSGYINLLGKARGRLERKSLRILPLGEVMGN